MARCRGATWPQGFWDTLKSQVKKPQQYPQSIWRAVKCKWNGKLHYRCNQPSKQVSPISPSHPLQILVCNSQLWSPGSACCLFFFFLSEVRARPWVCSLGWWDPCVGLDVNPEMSATISIRIQVASTNALLSHALQGRSDYWNLRGRDGIH